MNSDLFNINVRVASNGKRQKDERERAKTSDPDLLGRNNARLKGIKSSQGHIAELEIEDQNPIVEEGKERSDIFLY